jgi:hypothetical protein
MASLQFMRARGSAPQWETGTGKASLPGTRAPAALAERDERHDSASGLDAWIRELAEAAPPLTSARRRTLALLLNSPGPVPASPADAAVPD